MLKISFGNNTTKEVLLGHLDEFIKRNEKLLEDMNGYIEEMEGAKEAKGIISGKGDKNYEAKNT